MSKTKKPIKKFYKLSLIAEKESSPFYFEYFILSKTVEAVNNFNELYQVGRTGIRGGPPKHAQQDLYRAMLVFACAGLDYFVKRLVKTKLPELIITDKAAEGKFREYVRGGLQKEDSKELMKTLSMAIIGQNPRDVFLNEYIASMTDGSLQSPEELKKVSNASGLDKEFINSDKMNSLKDVFKVRNEIIHEMDINTLDDASKTFKNKTRRQRISGTMEKHTKTILHLAEELFSAYKKKFEEIEKKPKAVEK